MIKVLVVDDTPVMRLLLSRILGKDHELEVVGAAHNGQEALEMVKLLKPDVVTMDLYMPVMDGYQATRRIMETTPVPVVIVSAAYHPEEVEMTFQALKAGAVAILEKPFSSLDERHELSARELISTVKLMSQVKLVTRKPAGGQKNVVALQASAPASASASALATASAPVAPRPACPKTLEQLGGIRAVAIAASTGGPPVLQTILSGLPKDYPLPVYVVQHITPAFVQGLVDWLNITSAIPVRLASQDEIVAPGHCYLAPGGQNLSVTPGHKVRLTACSSDKAAICPSASQLFQSVLRAYGHRAAGVMLTGMGRDGVEELRHLRDVGALTMAQDKESSVVYGMPGEAAKAGAVEHVLAPAQIVEMLCKIGQAVLAQSAKHSAA